MTKTIMLYGATGYAGRLIAAEMRLVAARNPGAYRMLLAGRDAASLIALAQPLEMDIRVFGLTDQAMLQRALRDCDVLINAAGPFAWTAARLVQAAMAVRRHYVDINGEADVYEQLHMMGFAARELGLVCGAGFWAAASNLLLEYALQQVQSRDQVVDGELGAVRIAMSRIKTFSQGSARTVWRSQREQVLVAGKSDLPDGKGGQRPGLALWREPVGRLERVFDFSSPRQSTGNTAALRITSAASLIDTLAARLTVQRHGLMAGRIASYVEAGAAARLGYQLGAWLAPVIAVPAVRAVLQQPVELLPPGPDAIDRQAERHTIVLEIEDVFRSPIIDWRWETPNVYQFTAQLALAVAQQLADDEGHAFTGWLTPGQVLAPLKLELTGDAGALRNCDLTQRST